ncbi:MAG TPA: ATP-binding protein [Ramlibacter sp.]|uniref:sensor histidine kinase n=1 Tax=Ramlibacter sp. TaxID=1917967 RepID=UPI002B76F865|nr:ATP-binding protein [Ramlibacter sp.]HVZ44814.1 ATP-binding protein [Ramlibacter sp.]
MALSVNEASPDFCKGNCVDPMAVMRALHTLCADTDPASLEARIEAVLGGIVGATSVLLALWDEEANDWLPRSNDRAAAIGDAAIAGPVPLSLLSHAVHTAKPLVVADALADHRFSMDPYFRDVECCSAMAIPLVRRGSPRAVLIFENRAAPGAFGDSQLETVSAIAWLLIVTLDNARSYERLERRVIEQAQQLRDAQARIAALSRSDGRAQIATNVLHNVGNVLTSVNVSAHVVSKQVQESPSSRIADVAQLLSEASDDLQAFFGPGGKGQHVPAYLRELSQALEAERQQLLAELQRLCASVEHIKNVIAMQQSYASSGRLMERALITDLVEDALRIQEASMSRHHVQVLRDYAPVEIAAMDRTRVMQILVNLVENARQAMDEVPGERRLDVAVRQAAGSIVVSVRDCGCGISPENMQHIFSHGFTTKTEGHGFGLHSCSIAAEEMGGSLAAYSEGPGHGATFVLQLPASPAA